MRHLFVFSLFCVLCGGQVMGQVPDAYNAGIQFSANKTWDEIKKSAQEEGKYIFVDCYATWCLPCRNMDQLVYTDSSVAHFAGDRFICVKVQMDSTAKDDGNKRAWYPVVREFQKLYKIGGFPTFLFFSPTGEIVHREAGFKDAHRFRRILNDALDPEKQVYTLLGNYRNGVKDYRTMVTLATNVADLMGDRETSDSIAQDYYTNYLSKLDTKDLLTFDNITFISWWPKLLNSSDRYFRCIYDNQAKVDRIIGKNGFAQSMVDKVVSAEFIWNKILANGKKPKDVQGDPDWNLLESVILNKYGASVADRNIVFAKASWYTYKKNWPNAIKYNVEGIEKYGLDTSALGAYGINNMVFELILPHCDDHAILEKAARWMEVVMKVQSYNTDAIDTYANILYKLGQTKMAIAWQERAAKGKDPEIIERLNKMRNHISIWN